MPPIRFPSLASLALLLVAFAAGCGEPETTALDRETFVRAYVDIRAAALQTEDAEPTERQREDVLARYGVSAEDMVEFVEYHGEDVEYMRELWSEIEVRLEVDSLPRADS